MHAELEARVAHLPVHIDISDAAFVELARIARAQVFGHAHVDGVVELVAGWTDCSVADAVGGETHARRTVDQVALERALRVATSIVLLAVVLAEGALVNVHTSLALHCVARAAVHHAHTMVRADSVVASKLIAVVDA